MSRPSCRSRAAIASASGSTTKTAHVDVNYHDADGLMLATSVSGRREPLTDRAVLRRFLGNPTMTLGVIARIHWQALQLWRKRVRFYRKPAPPPEFVTR